MNKITHIAPGPWGEEAADHWGLLYVDAEGSMVSRPVTTLPGDYRLLYAGVRDALLGKGASPATPQDAWRVARVLEWARESSAQHREIECAGALDQVN